MFPVSSAGSFVPVGSDSSGRHVDGTEAEVSGGSRAGADWISTYVDTLLVFESPAGAIDLRRPVDGAGLTLLSRRKLPREFAVLTADNPLGEVKTASANAAAGAALERQLVEMSVRFVRLQGCSPDRTHCEASLAAGLDRDSAIHIAREYGQNAIFWFDGERFWLVGGLLDFEPVALPIG